MADDDRRSGMGPVVILGILLALVLCYIIFYRSDLIEQIANRPTVAGKQKEVDQLTAEVVQLTADKQELQESIVALQGKLEQTSSKLDYLDNQVTLKSARIITLEHDNLKLSEKLAAQPEIQKKADGFHFSMSAMAGTPVTTWKPEGWGILGAGKKQWQVLTGVGYSVDGVKLSLGVQWTW